MFGRLISILFICVALCFSVPAWAGSDAIIEIDNHTASFTGSWGVSGLGTGSGPFFYGDTISWAACNGNDSAGGAVTSEATWHSSTVGIGQQINGKYAVYVRATSDPNRTDSAQYRIYSAYHSLLIGSPWVYTLKGSCTVNQQFRGGEWVYCDTVTLDYPLGIGIGSYAAAVKLGNNCETGKYVVADAVRFVRQSWDHNDIVDEPGFNSVKAPTYSPDITSTSGTTPTQLTTAAIVCPRAGSVISTLSGEISIAAENGACPNWARISYSLSRTTAEDGTSLQSVGVWDNSDCGQSYMFTMSMHRVDTCTAGQTITIYALAHRWDTNTYSSSYAYQPTITLMYFPTQY